MLPCGSRRMMLRHAFRGAARYAAYAQAPRDDEARAELRHDADYVVIVPMPRDGRRCAAHACAAAVAMRCARDNITQREITRVT